VKNFVLAHFRLRWRVSASRRGGSNAVRWGAWGACCSPKVSRRGVTRGRKSYSVVRRRPPFYVDTTALQHCRCDAPIGLSTRGCWKRVRTRLARWGASGGPIRMCRPHPFTCVSPASERQGTRHTRPPSLRTVVKTPYTVTPRDSSLRTRYPKSPRPDVPAASLHVSVSHQLEHRHHGCT
jgi:hypothetical protein